MCHEPLRLSSCSEDLLKLISSQNFLLVGVVLGSVRCLFSCWRCPGFHLLFLLLLALSCVPSVVSSLVGVVLGSVCCLFSCWRCPGFRCLGVRWGPRCRCLGFRCLVVALGSVALGSVALLLLSSVVAGLRVGLRCLGLRCRGRSRRGVGSGCLGSVDCAFWAAFVRAWLGIPPSQAFPGSVVSGCVGCVGSVVSGFSGLSLSRVVRIPLL